MRSYRYLIPVLAVTAGLAHGSTTLYGSKTLLETGNIDLAFTNITFDAYVGFYNTSAGLLETVTGARFVGMVGANFDLQVTNSIGSWGGGAGLRNNNSNGTITVTMPVNAYAFGVDLLIGSGVGFLPFDVTFDNGTTQHFTTSNASGGPGSSSIYFGVRSSTPIVSVSLSNEYSGDAIALDNFDIGIGSTQADTPEATTLVLIGSGLIGLRLLRRRQTRLAC